MANPEIAFALTSTIAAAASAVGGLLATFAAFRSAGLTKEALEHSAALEQRRACAAIMELGQSVTAEHARVVVLIQNLKNENSNYAALTGNTQGSWLPQKARELTAIRQELDPLEQYAAEKLLTHHDLLKLSDDELTDLSMKLRRDLARLLNAREDLLDKLAHMREENQRLRAQVQGSK